MEIKLELEDFEFATTLSQFGDTRFLVVVVEGKPFSVYRQLDPRPFRSPERDACVDRVLIEKMEFMLRKVFVDACKAIPYGTNLLDEEVR